MFKILKQELLFIPLLLILLELIRAAIFHFYPNTAFFDRGSELETFVFRVWQMVWISCTTWLLIRVTFPAAFRSLKKFYCDYEKFTDQYKQDFSLKLYLTLFFGLVLLLSGKANNHENQIRKNLTDTLEKQLFVREATGNNDGIEVERYLNFVGRSKGDAWCAAYVSYNYHAVGINSPKSAWAPVFSNPKYVIWSQALVKCHRQSKPLPGDCFTLYFPSQKRVGHTGFIIGETENYFITNEGNTNLGGSREGSGTQNLKRAKSKIYTISNYITPNLIVHEKTTYTFTIVRNVYSWLQSQNDSINGKNNRCLKGQCISKRICFLSGLSIKSQGRQLQDQSNGKTRREGTNQYAFNYSRNGTLESIRLNYRWEAASRLCLQRAGVTGKNKEPDNRILREAIPVTTTRKNYNSKGASPVYSEMG